MTPTTPSLISDQAAGERDTLVKDLRSYARIMRTKEDNQHCVDRDCADAAEQMEWAALRIEGLEHQISKQVPGDADYPGTNADIIEKALYCNLHGDTESVENWLNHLRDRITAPTTGSAPVAIKFAEYEAFNEAGRQVDEQARPFRKMMGLAPTQGADAQTFVGKWRDVIKNMPDTYTQGADGESLRPVAIEAPRPSVFRSFETMCWPAPCEALGEIGHRLTYDHSDKSDRLVAASVISAYQHLMSMPAKRRDAIVSELRKGPGVIAASAPMEKT